jgi:1-acyl-sn-glycerol-3-phosphate acyltransferase
MNDEQQPAKTASILRWLTVGVASYLGWLIVMVVFIIIFPILAVVGLVDRSGGYQSLRGFFSGFLRWFFLGYLSFIRLHRFAEIPSRETIEGAAPCVFVANHRSWLDALFAMSVFPNVRLPVKSSYMTVPLLGLAIRWMGCIPMDRTSNESIVAGITECRRALADGSSLFVFPESTRAPRGKMLAFSDVFFRVALEADVPVVPVLLHSDIPYLSPDEGSMLTFARATWRIRVFDPLPRDTRDRASDLSRMAKRMITAGLADLADDRP